MENGTVSIVTAPRPPPEVLLPTGDNKFSLAVADVWRWLVTSTMGSGDSNAYTTISAPPRAAGDIRTNGDKSNVHSQ